MVILKSDFDQTNQLILERKQCALCDVSYYCPNFHDQMRSMRYLLIIVLFCLVHFSSKAQLSSTDSLDQILDNVIIQSDLFGHDEVGIAGSVSRIQPQMINRANSVQLQPVINAVPGVYMQSGALNTNRITIRGIGARSPFSTNKIKAYLDEIPLSSGEGETAIEDIDFATLGGLEIYRGPVSTIYGAGLGGAINMLSKNPGGTNNAYFESSFGSYGLFRLQAGLELSSDKNSLGVYYQNVTSDGYRENNEYDRQSITVIGKSLLGERSVLSSYLNYSHLKAFIPSSLNEEDYINNPRQAASSWGNAKGNEDNDRFRLGVSIATDWNNRTESTAAVFVNTGRSDEVRPTFLGNTGAQSTNFGFRGRVKQKFLPKDNLSLVLGTEVFFENFDYKEFENIDGENGDKTLDFFQNRNYGNVFLVTEYRPIEKWLLTLGGNFNWSGYELNDKFGQGANSQTGSYKFDPIFSPKLSVSYFLQESISIYGLVAHGFSLPTFEETLYPEGMINTNLRPESGYNFELGIKGNVFDNRLSFELATYRMPVTDLIVERIVNEVPVGVNAGSANYDGLEAMLNHVAVRSERFTLNHRLSLSWMKYHFDSFVDGDSDFSGNQMTGVPDRTLDYSITATSKLGLYGNVNWQSVGAMPILDDNSIYTESYNLVNLKVGYQKDLGSFNLNVYTGVNNLFDEKYASMIQINTFTGRYYYPGLPINYFAGAKIRYNF